MNHKSGFVNILGNPNVGKSTLMNALLGHNLSITTSKAQTTRHRILGILNGDNYQIVFSDTPGLIDPSYKLQQSMVRASASALEDADVIVLVTTPGDYSVSKDDFFSKIETTTVPKIIVINKADLSSQQEIEADINRWTEIVPGATVIPVSAKLKFNLVKLLNETISLLPYGEPFFPDNQISDRFERFFASEIIREKILLNYKKEVPYSVEVEIEEFKEEASLIRISSMIHVERATQKGILIGHKGAMLKRTGTMARISLEQFFGKKVFLEMRVKVSADWRKNSSMLKRFGYQ